MKKYYALLIIVLCCSIFCIGQNQGNNWFFGQYAGLDFSTSPPTAVAGSALNVFEGCSTISDDLGNLLFMTEGINVWNRNQVVMSNGSGLLGNSTASQQLSFKSPGSTNEYFVVTTGGGRGLYYSIVDMNLDGGLGAVDASRKNILLNSSFFIEKVTAYIDTIGSNHWILTYISGIYYAYPIVNGTVQPSNVVISNIQATASMTDPRGTLKLSPDGSKIINTSVGNLDQAFLTDFNPLTGVVSNPVTLSTGTGFNIFYGAEFSPDSALIYLNGNNSNSGNGCGATNGREIFQFEINSSAGWNTTPVALGGSTGANSGRGALQLGPDGKIYFARTCQPWLGVIQNPTVVGTGASYVDDGIALDPQTLSREGLPNFATSSYATTYNEITGSARFDFSGSGCTTNSQGFANLLFEVNSSSQSLFAMSNESGDYSKNVPNGQFTVTPQPENPTYWTFTPSSVVIDFPAQSSPAIEDFCVTPNGVHEDLEIVVIPLQLARPGFDVNYKAIIKNKGNQVSSGTVTLDFPAEYMSVASTTPAAVTAPATRVSWNYTNIAPFNSEEFLFTMSMNTPTATPIPLLGGEVLFFTGTVNVTGTDVLPLDNVMTLKQRVVNSYDPNDKTCLEGETIEPSMVGDYVHYLIRFENMGTASAVNVVITDQINSNQFDITTLLPLDASHSYHTNFNENNEVEFIFENINLDFNDATNDGYMLFKIKTLSTLNVGDTFDNTAQIFFDYNAPIVTNTETVTVQSTASVNDTTDATISVYPNPAREFIQVQSSSSLRSIQVTNMNGSVLNQTQLTGNISSERVSLSGLASGIYIVVVQSDKGKKVEKLIVY